MKLFLKYKFSIYFVFLVSLTCCGQNKNKQENMITKEQYNNISKEVKIFNYNPTYQLKVNANLCTYEVYVNDVLVDFSFSTGQTAGEQNIDIPQYILKSGKQTIRYRIYPKAIQDGVLEEMLDPNATFSLRIVHGEYYKESFDSFKEDLNLTLPKLEVSVPFFEFSSSFMATVPYELKGWSDGVDLSKEDSKELEKELLSIYNKYRTAWLNKDVSVIATMIYKREKEIAQSHYMSPATARILSCGAK